MNGRVEEMSGFGESSTVILRILPKSLNNLIFGLDSSLSLRMIIGITTFQFAE